MKQLLIEALPFLETYLQTLVASYTSVQRDGTSRLMRRDESVDQIERIALDDIERLQRLIPKMTAASV